MLEKKQFCNMRVIFIHAALRVSCSHLVFPHLFLFPQVSFSKPTSSLVIMTVSHLFSSPMLSLPFPAIFRALMQVSSAHTSHQYPCLLRFSPSSALCWLCSLRLTASMLPISSHLKVEMVIPIIRDLFEIKSILFIKPAEILRGTELRRCEML